MAGLRTILRLRAGVAAGATLIALGALSPASAAPPAGKSEQCFLISNVNGFSAPNNHTVLIRVGVNEIYRLALFTDCGDLSFREHLGFERQPADPWICSPLDATVVNREDGIAQRCPVTAIHKLTPEEVAAVPKKDLP